MRIRSLLVAPCFLIVLPLLLPTNSLAGANKATPLKSKATNLSFVEKAYPYDMSAGDTQDFVYVIQNNGASETKLNIAGFSAPMVRDSTVPNNCGDTLAVGKKCYVKLTTTPADEMAIKQVLNKNQTLGSLH